MGAVLTPPAVFLCLLVRNPGPAFPGSGSAVVDYLLASIVLGPMLGLFVGAVGGWVWLVVAVGRESRHAAQQPPDAPRSDGEATQLPHNPRQSDQDS